MSPPLLTSHDAAGHIHLIVGSSSLASSRCSKSIEVGAKPIVLAPEGSWIHYGLQKKVDEGRVQLVRREVSEADLRNLGRDEVDNVVDAVFVTLGKDHPTSMPHDAT